MLKHRNHNRNNYHNVKNKCTQFLRITIMIQYVNTYTLQASDLLQYYFNSNILCASVGSHCGI